MGSQTERDVGSDRACRAVSVIQTLLIVSRGKYDQDYLSYLQALIKSMEPFGIVCYVVRFNQADGRL